MGKTGVLGAFEELVLLALVRQGDDAYGVSIRRDLVEQTGTEVTMGAVYATLDRLEEKKLIRVREPEAPSGRRGRPRRCFEIISDGVAALARTQAVRETMWSGVDISSLIGREPTG